MKCYQNNSHSDQLEIQEFSFQILPHRGFKNILFLFHARMEKKLEISKVALKETQLCTGLALSVFGLLTNHQAAHHLRMASMEMI